MPDVMTVLLAIGAVWLFGQCLVQLTSRSAALTVPYELSYAKLKLAYARLHFYMSRPVVGYFGKDEPMGFTPPRPTDCAIILQSDNNFRVHGVITRTGN